MCTHHDKNRRLILSGMGAAASLMALPTTGFATEATTVLGGSVQLDGKEVTSVTRKTFSLKAGAQGSVIRNRDQIFYLDPETEAAFERGETGIISDVIIAAGGILSVLGPSKDRNIRISTPNAVGSIRGTTTYFAWQEAENRSYVCCCYGGVDLENQDGGTESLRTRYHSAVVLPRSGGVSPAPYDRPLDHYDDDIEVLENLAGRRPRWQLPDGKMHFLSPSPPPLG